MPEPTPPSRSRRRAPAATLLVLTTLLLAACGAGTSTDTGDGASQAADPGTAAGTPATTAQAPAAGETDGATEPEVANAQGGLGALAALAPTDSIHAMLGETPAPDCDTSVLTGSDSCVWKAADGSWLKLEHGPSPEMPDVAAFTERATKTLGLDAPVAGLGEAAYLGSSSRGTRIAVFKSDANVLWVVLNKAGDPTAQATQVTDLATAALAGM